MLLVSATKCCTKIKMPCPLPHNHYCCSLPSPVCLLHLLSAHLYMLYLFTHRLPTIICVVDVFFFFVFFLILVTCYISL